MGFLSDNVALEVLSAFLLSFWLFYLYFVKDYGYWESKNIVHIPAVFPFGSMVKPVMGKCFWGKALDEAYKEYPDQRYVGLFYVRKPMLIIRDPDIVREVIVKDFHYFMDHMGIDTHPKDYMMCHLSSMKGQEWKELRTKLTPAYTTAKVKSMFYIIKRSNDMLTKVVDQSVEINRAVDVKDILSRYSIDVIANCAFGLEIDSLLNKDSKFYEAGVESLKVDFAVLFKIFVYAAFPIFSKVHFFDFQRSKIRDFITGVVRSTIEYREKHKVSRLDFLDQLIKLRQNQSILERGEKPETCPSHLGSCKKEGLTIEEIAAETYLFFTSAYETTSTTIMFCLYELACNDKIQEKLYCEVEEVLDRYGGDISYQAMQEMTYMDQVISETLRRYPVFSHLSRDCTQKYKFSDSKLEIDKDVGLVVPVYSLHHDPKYFPDPFTFNPDRFSPENCNKRHPYVYLPFGEGPRMCIGMRFGLMKIKTALATLLVDYQFSLNSDTDVPLQFKSNSFTTLPSKPLMLVFIRRHNQS
uniref:Cytochrome P450 n=1 Tax=Graphocephala atropunctata TaxID=36148 RepID=A0A1B6L3I1_9HEMI